MDQNELENIKNIRMIVFELEQRIKKIEDPKVAEELQNKARSIIVDLEVLRARNGIIIGEKYQVFFNYAVEINMEIQKYFEEQAKNNLENREKAITELTSVVQEKSTSELWAGTRKIVNEWKKYCEENPRYEGHEFNKTIAKEVLKILKQQPQKGEEIDLSPVQEICSNADLISVIKENLIEISRKSKTLEAGEDIMIMAKKLNEENLNNPELWEVLTGIEGVKVAENKKTELSLSEPKEKFDIKKLIFGKCVYTLGDIDEETGEWINLKEVYGRFPNIFSAKEAARVVKIEINGVKKIKSTDFSGDNLFCKRYPNLEEVVLGDDVEELEEKTFFVYSNIKRVTIGKGIKEIPELCFANPSLESIVIPGTIEKIREGAFSGCENLKYVKLGNGIKKIPTSCFECTKLEDIVIPDSVERIGNRAFWHSKYLKSVEMGEKVMLIDGEAFSDCVKLERITIKNRKNVIIDCTAFKDCRNLKIVVNKEGEEMNIKEFLQTYFRRGRHFIPKEKKQSEREIELD